MKVDVWHNIMWSKYKATVFSKLHALSGQRAVSVRIFQIAETRKERISLSTVDYDVHRYPYVNIFKGAYEDIPLPVLFWKLAKICFQTDADFVILNGYERPEVWAQAFMLLLRRKKFGFFCDSTIFDNPQLLWKGVAKRLIFSLGSAFFCYGQRSREYLRYYGVPDKLIFTRCQAASLPDDYDAATIPAKRAAVVAKPSEPRFLFVGRLAREKHVNDLLRSFAKVLVTYPLARLVIVGKGPLEQDLRTLTDELGIAPSVDFTGSKSGDNLWAEFLNATSLVLPSYSEPWGLVVNEALSFGCPVVVSHRCGCVPELVIDGETGFQFDCGNIDDLTQKMLQVVDFGSPEQVTNNCLDRIAEFTPEHAALAILDGIQEWSER